MTPEIKSKLAYRPEIDGLRSIAVVSVILYHAQLNVLGRNTFEGGYIGVDIFFVISGYLITRITISELKDTGSFSFKNFYERRARRILPVLLLVIFVATPFAWKYLLPADLVEYAESILASLFFGSNFFFYIKSTDYGGTSALLKPFLHTWSLGVEEQFYLIFPIIAVTLFRFVRNAILPVLIILSLMSLQFSEVMEIRNPDLNFYLPFSRFWELAAGSILAYKELHFRSVLEKRGWSQALPIVGLLLIIYSIFFFDAKTSHPGYSTIIPILGVSLIIGFASSEILIGKFLSSRPMVWTGLISYSAYLWHFPIFAFSRNKPTDPTNYDKLEWIALTVILSILSYFLVESTFRNKRLISTRAMLTILSISAVMIISFMTYIKISHGAWGRYDIEVTGQDDIDATGQREFTPQEFIQLFNRAEFDRLVHPDGIEGTRLLTGELTSNCNLREPREACRYGSEKLVFLGDSYVGHLERAVLDTLGRKEFGFISMSYDQCPFVTDQIWFGDNAECPYVNEERRAIITSFSDQKIFVISLNEHQFGIAKERTANPLNDGRRKQKAGTPVDPEIAWNSYFESINWLLEQGHKVVLIRSLPMTHLDAQKWLGENIEYVKDMNFPQIYNTEKPRDVIEIDNNRYPEFDPKSVLTIDPAVIFCVKKTNLCVDILKDYGPLYNSDRHLSYLGSALLASKIKEGILQRGW